MAKKRNLTAKILTSLAFGLIVGIIVYQLPSSTFKETILINGVFQFLGQVFLRAIMMVVIPLVFVSLVNGAANMGDVKKLGRVGVKTILFYLTTTALAVTLALALGYFLKPGYGLNMGSISSVEVTIAEKTPLIQVLYEMIPNNVIAAMANGNMLQIIIFALVTGVALSMLGDRAKTVLKLFDELNEVVMKLVEIVMLFAPFGVFGLIAKTFSTAGYSAMIPLLKFILVVYLGLVIHMIVVYGLLLRGLGKLSVTKFFKKFSPATFVAFSTASSSATIPFSLDICENKIGVSKDIASFTIPLGATVNMDGTAIMQGVAAFFVAQVYGVDLSFSAMLTIVLTATLASIGTAGVPGAGTIMLSMVLQSVGLPLEGIGLIMGIDRIVDMGRTAVNVTGDAVCTTIIAKQENELNEDIFNS